MIMPKRVGVTYRDASRVEPYRKALEAAGVEPVLIDPDHPQPIDSLDGLLLTGERRTSNPEAVPAGALTPKPR